MSAGAYVAGLAFLTATLGLAGAAAEVVLRRRLDHLAGLVRLLARAVLITCAVTAAHLVPGVIGALGRETVLLAALVMLLAASRLPPAAVNDSEAPAVNRETAPDPEQWTSRIAWGVAAVAAGAAAAFVVAELLDTASKPLTAPDMVSFDLPIVAGWMRSGSVWTITELFPLQTHGTYPHNAHVLLLAAMLPFDNDTLVRLVAYPFLALAALSVYALTIELRVPRPTAIAFAALLVAIPVVATSVEYAPLDTIAAGMFAAGILFLVRHARTGRTTELVLAGLGLGFAFGAKWYDTTAVAAVVSIWAIANLATLRRVAPVLRHLGLLAAVIAGAGGFWLVRNLVEAGNPLYPQPVTVFGITLFDAPRDVLRELAGFTIADYLGDWSVWRMYIAPAFRTSFGLGGALVMSAALVAPFLIGGLRRGRPPGGHRRVLGLALMALALLAVYLVTPFTAFGFEGRPALTSANTRYLIPGLTVAVPVAAWTAARGGWIGSALHVLALLAVLLGVRESIRLLSPGAPAIALGAGVVIVVGAAAWLCSSGRIAMPRAGAAAGIALGAAILAVGGYAIQRAINDDRYAGEDPTYAWVQRHAPRGTEIGLAGSYDFSGVSPAWPLYGPRIGNRVSYVGPLDGGHLSQYQMREAWARTLRHRGYDLVLVARARSALPTRADEPRWARLEALLPVARSPRFDLYRVPARPAQERGRVGD